jgi:adenylate cyclase
VEMPVWIGREVTGDPRYYNSNLTVHPYRLWRHEAP